MDYFISSRYVPQLEMKRQKYKEQKQVYSKVFITSVLVVLARDCGCGTVGTTVTSERSDLHFKSHLWGSFLILANKNVWL